LGFLQKFLILLFLIFYRHGCNHIWCPARFGLINKLNEHVFYFFSD
jgi:hypothetical protein